MVLNFFLSGAKRKGQSAFEIAIITGIMLFIFLIFFVVLANKTYSIQVEQDTQMLQDYAKTVGTELILASSSENGYVRDFSIPDTIDGINFSINLLTDSVSARHSEVVVTAVNYPSDIQAVEVVSEKICGQLSKGKNTVKKINDMVLVNAGLCAKS